MQISFFTIGMSVLWSSIVFLLFYILRRKNIVLEVCSLSGIILLYLFCMIRLVVPIELPWTQVLYGGVVLNRYNDFMEKRVILFQTEQPMYRILLLIWGIGAVLLVFRYVLRYGKLVWLYERLPKAEEERIDAVLQRVNKEQKRIPEVVKTSLVSVPCCFGILKKRILLPARTYTEEKLQFILLHECTHLRCNDTLINLMTNVLCACYWWNPFVYLLKRDLNQSMELRCDRLVIDTMGKDTHGAYLETLLSEYKGTHKKGDSKRVDHLVSQLFEQHTECLVERFERLSNGKRKSEKAGKLFTLLLSVVILVVSYSFVLQSRYACPVEEIETGPDSHEVSAENAYLLERSDGTYVFCTEYGEDEIKRENVELLLQSGVPLRKENE